MRESWVAKKVDLCSEQFGSIWHLSPVVLTIGEGRRKLETSTITLCTTKVKKGMIKVK